MKPEHDAEFVRRRIEAVLERAAPRGRAHWPECIRAVEVHADRAGSNWTVRSVAAAEDERLIGLAATLVRAECPRVAAD